MKYDMTSDCAAEIAEDVCRLFKEGKRGVFVYNNVPFELTDIARCSEFVRECCEASAGKKLPYFGGSARETEEKLKGAGKKVLYPKRGDIVCFNSPDSGKWGHIGIYLGNSLFAENTSSKTRGPGFVISNINDMHGRITGFYSILPARKIEEDSKTIKIINYKTGMIIAQYKMVNGGNHIEDQGKLYVIT